MGTIEPEVGTVIANVSMFTQFFDQLLYWPLQHCKVVQQYCASNRAMLSHFSPKNKTV